MLLLGVIWLVLISEDSFSSDKEFTTWDLSKTPHKNSKDCWCEPELDYEDPETGAQVWVHREIH
jgi:hypothetical protein